MKHWATSALLGKMQNTALLPHKKKHPSPNTNKNALSLSLSTFPHIIRFKLLTKSNLRQSSAQWRRKLPALVRLIEAAHYRVSLTRQVYSDTTNLKERVKKLAIAFHNEMRKQGNRTFHVPKISCLPRRRPFTILSEETVLNSK